MKAFAIGSVLGALIYAQVAPLQVFQATDFFEWKNSPDIDLKETELGIYPLGALPNDPANTAMPVKFARVTSMVPGQVQKVAKTDLFLDVPDGDYTVYARHIDDGDNIGPWSATSESGRSDITSPLAPVGFKKTTVTTTTTTVTTVIESTVP